MSIQWNATLTEVNLIHQIANRAIKLIYQPNDIDMDTMKIQMDLQATHCSGCPLDLAGLLAFPNLDFSHDIIGIQHHIDRNTGELRGGFLPRCALITRRSNYGDA